MSSERYRSFEDFWPFYVREHSLPATRAMHFIGTSCGLISLALSAVSGNWLYLPLGIVVSYAFAWVSHFFIEKNRPATFKYPVYSFLSDFRMYGFMWRGKMDAEVARIMKGALEIPNHVSRADV